MKTKPWEIPDDAPELLKELACAVWYWELYVAGRRPIFEPVGETEQEELASAKAAIVTALQA